MYARVATFEGGEPDAIREAADYIEKSDGPPEGVPSSGITVMSQGDRTMVIGFFATEADLEEGDRTLNAMDPSGGPGNMGRRASVERYEVLVQREAGD